jgi:uncharacterized protein YodC (DUF2158 family)
MRKRVIAADRRSNTLEYKVGDTVRLMSDGPLMTIIGFPYATNTAECSWFKDGVNQRARFPLEAIYPAVRPDADPRMTATPLITKPQP